MSSFFDGTRPGTKIDIGGRTFELPVLYFRDDCFGLFFRADLEKIRELLPSEKLHPLIFPRKKAAVAIVAFNYIDTTIGPYGEVGIVVPVVYSSDPPPRIRPILKESGFPGFGVLVTHLPVTNTIARDGGRGGWGYTKFVADMEFTITPEFMECRMFEEQKHILTMRVVKKGRIRKDSKPLVTYSVKDGNLLKTTIPQTGIQRMSLLPFGSFLNLGDHPVAHSIRELNLGSRPIMSRYYLERSAILPEGEVIEEGVKPLDGYFGKDRDGEHEVKYIERMD
jgi:hypothetical protein